MRALLLAIVGLWGSGCFSTDAITEPCPSGLAPSEVGSCSCTDNELMVPGSSQACSGVITDLGVLGDATRELIDVELFDNGTSRRLLLLERSFNEVFVTVYGVEGEDAEITFSRVNVFRAAQPQINPIVPVIPKVLGLEVMAIAEGQEHALVFFFDGTLLSADLSVTTDAAMTPVAVEDHPANTGIPWSADGQKMVFSTLAGREGTLAAGDASHLMVYGGYSESGFELPLTFQWFIGTLELVHTPEGSTPITARFNPTTLNISPDRALGSVEVFTALLVSFNTALGSNDLFTAQGATVYVETYPCTSPETHNLCPYYNESEPLLYDVLFQPTFDPTLPPVLTPLRAGLDNQAKEALIDAAQEEVQRRFDDDGSSRSRENFGVVFLASGSIGKDVVAVGAPVFLGCRDEAGVLMDCSRSPLVAEGNQPIYQPVVFMRWRRDASSGLELTGSAVVRELAVGTLVPLQNDALGLGLETEAQLFAANILRRDEATDELIFSFEVLDTSEGVVTLGSVELERVDYEPLGVPSMTAIDDLIFVPSNAGLRTFHVAP